MIGLKKKLKILAAVCLFAVLLSACGAAAPAEPTTDPNVIFTQVAETVMVSMTQTSEAMPPTPEPQPTATAAPTDDTIPTSDPNATQAAPTSQVIGPTATIPRVGDSAQYNTQTPADGKGFQARCDFQFIVCFGNNGTTTGIIPIISSGSAASACGTILSISMLEKKLSQAENGVSTPRQSLPDPG